LRGAVHLPPPLRRPPALAAARARSGGCAQAGAPGRHPIEWSLAWVAAGCVAFVLWARVEKVWPFGPKEISEEYAAGADPDTEGGTRGTGGGTGGTGGGARGPGDGTRGPGDGTRGSDGGPDGGPGGGPDGAVTPGAPPPPTAP
ncbi:hypothetical protein ACWEWX_19950, partial [Streptomyces asiaticus]